MTRSNCGKNRKVTQRGKAEGVINHVYHDIFCNLSL